jgi:class 3 adenylate cyclase/tetratricopeptide (TPR) repeat protein
MGELERKTTQLYEEGIAEYRRATIMFVDLSGFSSMANVLPPHTTAELLSKYHERIGNIVTKYGGVIDNVVGDGMVITFGVPRAKEYHAQAAVLAALETQSKDFSEVRDGREFKLRSHIGINTGRVLYGKVGPSKFKKQSVIGDAVNLAERLSKEAEAGEIIIGEDTYKSLFDISAERLESRMVKGWSEPVNPYKVLGKTKPRIDYETKFVDREAEVNKFKSYVEKAIQGEGSIVTIGGEAGVGKTRIWWEVLKEYPEVEVDHVLVFPFKLKPFHAPEDILVKEYGITISDLFEKQHPDLRPEQKKQNVVAEIKTLLYGTTKEKPRVMIYEDKENFDPSSMEVLNSMKRDIHNYPLLVLTTSRIEKGHIPVGKLEDVYLRQIAENVAEGKLNSEEISDILKKSQGIPLFLIEIAKAKKEAFPGMPERVEDIVSDEIDRLGKRQAYVLRYASIIDHGFGYELMKELTDYKDEELRKALDKLERKGVIKPFRNQFIISKPLIKEVMQGRVVPNDRKKIHERVAKFYERTKPEDFDLLALHYLNSDNLEKALEYSVKAGDKAKDMFAIREASSYYKNALETLEKMEEIDKGYKEKYRGEKIKITLNLADTCIPLGKYTEALSVLADLLETKEIEKEPKEEAEIWYTIGKIHGAKGDLEDEQKSYKNALGLMEEHGIADPILEWKINNNMGCSFCDEGDYDSSLKYHLKNFEIAEELGDKKLKGYACTNIAIGYGEKGDFKKALEYCKAALQMAKDIKDETLLTKIYNELGCIYTDKKDFEAAKDFHEEGLKTAKTVGDVDSEIFILANLSEVFFNLGDKPTAKKYREEAYKIAKEIGNETLIKYIETELDKLIGYK